jgi:hypothetical protein
MYTQKEKSQDYQSETSDLTFSSHVSHDPSNHPSTTPDQKDSISSPSPLIKENILRWTVNRSEHLHKDEDIFLQPFGHYIENINSSTTLRIVMQNPQFALHLTRTNHDLPQVINNIKKLQGSVFAAISPNVNFCNVTHTLKFKSPFKRAFHQVHLAASSSEIGAQAINRNRETLTGGTAILTFDHWASRVTSTQYDARGHGTYSVTTYQGKNGRCISLIAAYIAVQKGSIIGETSVYAQQVTLMELEAKNKKIKPRANYCPRKDAIKELSNLIASLQEKEHVIILMIDANQASIECVNSKGIKPHSIEWLRVEHGLDDPFIEPFGGRPPTTTINNGRDIDFVFTWGVQTDSVTTLAVNTPASSDHLGICIDINTETLFQCKYDKLSSCPRRKLTLNNVKTKLNYISYITKQWTEQKFFQRAQLLYAAMIDGNFTATHFIALQELDKQITHTLLTGEYKCAKNDKDRNPWSPDLCMAGLHLSYWKKKYKMSLNKAFRWHILDSLNARTNIALHEHKDISQGTIRNKLREARRHWKDIKQKGNELRQQFLQDRADDYATKRNIKPAQALKTIKQAEQSKTAYRQINDLIGGKKQKTPLTQIEINNPADNIPGIHQFLQKPKRKDCLVPFWPTLWTLQGNCSNGRRGQH